MFTCLPTCDKDDQDDDLRLFVNTFSFILFDMKHCLSISIFMHELSRDELS